MSQEHLSMALLIAVRDGDRSEPGYATAHRHAAECPTCRAELDALHQRTAQLKALGTLEPSRSVFPAVRARLAADRRHQWQRRLSWAGLAAAACLVLTVVGFDLIRPQALDASAQLDSAMSRSQLLEQALEAYRPDQRVLDSRTVELVISLEDRIADVDARLARTATLDKRERLAEQVELWQERVGLMSALVDVHLNKATNVGL
jgi:hypothetical protein